MKKARKETLFVIISVVFVLAFTAELALASQDKTGSGAPSGVHYNLNLIGMKKPKGDIGCGEGHRIFVQLGEVPSSGKLPKTTSIHLIKGDEFDVIDCDGTDGDAYFQLPDPNGGDPNCTAYSVYVRALGKPDGKAVMTTCATDPGEDGILGTGDDIEVCSEENVVLERKKGQEKKAAGSQKFVNVSKELLTICAYVCVQRDETTGECLDWEWRRLYLFDPLLQDYLWKYDNNGLKLAQLRFYPQKTCYPTEGQNSWGCP